MESARNYPGAAIAGQSPPLTARPLLDRVLERRNELCSELQSLGNRAEQLADRLIGPVPETEPGKDGIRKEPGTAMEKLDALDGAAAHLCMRLNRHLARLEAL